MGGWILAAVPYVATLSSLIGAVLLSRPYLSPSLALRLDSAIFAAQFVSWWFLLGVLQTIGFGSGLQSGVMFMLPHMLRTTVLADECGHLNFDSLGDMWYNTDPTLFQCNPSSSSSASASAAAAAAADSDGGGGSSGLAEGTAAAAAAVVPFSLLVLRLLPSAVCFQVGATCGEVPPYFMSYTAAEAKRINALVDTEEPQSAHEKKHGAVATGGGENSSCDDKDDDTDSDGNEMKSTKSKSGRSGGGSGRKLGGNGGSGGRDKGGWFIRFPNKSTN